MSQAVKIFDTTLRDGTQGEKVAFSAEDKVQVAQKLDQLDIDYIEGGWPGSNPRDMEFFDLVADVTFDHAKIVAFGSTCRAGNTPEEDKNLSLLIEADTPAVAIFGKSWLFHVTDALQITPDENLRIIRDSVGFLKDHDKEVIYDAEHFFDGYKANPEYTLRTLKAAEAAGADFITLCDTNGGTLPHEVTRIIEEVRPHIQAPLGLHGHNDCEMGVANAVAAVRAGCSLIQGTINGYGERCGNTNLCSLIPNLQLKQNYHCISDEKLEQLTSVSRFVSEVANLKPDIRQPYVGRSSFAHKGGIHVSAVMKNAETYEHIRPEQIGNQRRVLVSDLSGKSNVKYKAEELNLPLEKHKERIPEIVQELKKLENKGYQFEAAEASFELLVQRMTGEWNEFFTLEGFRIIAEKNVSGKMRTEASLRLKVNNQIEHCAAEGHGPVHALDKALRKALGKFYPEIDDMQLTDYKVRVLNEKDGTGADVRVLIDSAEHGDSWGTVGVSHNIIDASWQALTESFSYFLAKKAKNSHHKEAI
ncbi:MAG TPA: citramalate synthase [Fodinibius sp.]|nr:citramalate synthase [Fodinibius sp.]